LKKGQGTFEYVLLLAGVLLIVVLAIVLLRGGIFGGGAKDVALQSCKAELAKSPGCYTGSEWNPAGEMAIGDACKAFESGYPNYVQILNDKCAPPTIAGRDLTIFRQVESTIEYACCGIKPV
jgi:hypothetical protein